MHATFTAHQKRFLKAQMLIQVLLQALLVVSLPLSNNQTSSSLSLINSDLVIQVEDVVYTKNKHQNFLTLLAAVPLPSYTLNPTKTKNLKVLQDKPVTANKQIASYYAYPTAVTYQAALANFKDFYAMMDTLNVSPFTTPTPTFDEEYASIPTHYYDSSNVNHYYGTKVDEYGDEEYNAS